MVSDHLLLAFLQEVLLLKNKKKTKKDLTTPNNVHFKMVDPYGACLKCLNLYLFIALFLLQSLFSDPGHDDIDQISKVRREVNEVKGVMTQNIGML